MKSSVEYWKNIVKSFDNARCLVIGDVMLDEYVYGELKGVASEAQSQIFLEFNSSHTFSLGGASNVAANIHSLGGKSLFSGVLGNDVTGKKVNLLMSTMGISTEGIFIDKYRPTTLKERHIARSERGSEQQIYRKDRESTAPITSQIENMIFNYVIKNKSNYKLIIFSDYGKGVLTDKLCGAIINFANNNNIPIIVDPKGQYKKFDGAYLLKPNKKEILEMTSEKKVEMGVKKIFKDTSIKYVVVTLGNEGMTLFSRENEPLHINAYGCKAVDVIGAGDTVTTIFGLGLQTGASLEDLTHLASIAAGIVVGKKGTAMVSQYEILNLIEKENIKSRQSIKKVNISLF